MASPYNVANSSRNATEVNNLNLTNTAQSQHISMELLTMIQITCYSVIVVIGTIGNLALITDIARKGRHKTSQYFILNLATVDLLTCTLSIPFDTIILLISSWPFGSGLCRVIYPLQTIFMAVSVSTLLCMALERYRAIIHPLKPKLSGRMILAVITLIWVIGFGLVSPYGAALKLKGDDCVENWPNNEAIYPKAFTLCVFLLLYMSPLCVISVAYTRIGLRLRDQGREAKCFVAAKNVRNSSKYRAQQNIRIVKFFVIAVIAFAVCLLPFQVMWMWSDFGHGQDWKHFNTLLTFANVMVYTNSAVNPFIFGAIGRRYNCCKRFYQQRQKARISTPSRFSFYRPIRKQRARSPSSNYKNSRTDNSNEDVKLCAPKNSCLMQIESNI